MIDIDPQLLGSKQYARCDNEEYTQNSGVVFAISKRRTSWNRGGATTLQNECDEGRTFLYLPKTAS